MSSLPLEPTFRLTLDGYTLSPLRAEQMEPVRVWRNASLSVLRQSAPIEPEQQARYYSEVVKPNQARSDPQLLLFALTLAGELIGYGGVVHIAWEHRRAEVSFLLSPERAAHHRQYVEDFRRFLGLITRVAFEHMALERLCTETYDLRPHHVSALEQSGFRPEGRLRAHVIVEGQRVDSLLHGLLAGEWSQR